MCVTPKLGMDKENGDVVDLDVGGWICGIDTMFFSSEDVGSDVAGIVWCFVCWERAECSC